MLTLNLSCCFHSKELGEKQFFDKLSVMSLMWTSIVIRAMSLSRWISFLDLRTCFVNSFRKKAFPILDLVKWALVLIFLMAVSI